MRREVSYIEKLISNLGRNYQHLTDAPDDDPNIKKLHKIGKALLNTNEKDNQLIEKAFLMADLGLGPKEVSSYLGRPRKEVNQLFNDLAIPVKPIFKYLAEPKEGLRLYAKTPTPIYKFFNFLKWDQLVDRSRLNQKINLTKGKFYWFMVFPNSLYYLTKADNNDQAGWFLKVDEHSFGEQKVEVSRRL